MKKGISLIVLVITIIVMIIIAGAIIISLNSTNIIDKANTAVDASNESELKSAVALAYMNLYVEYWETKDAGNTATTKPTAADVELDDTVKTMLDEMNKNNSGTVYSVVDDTVGGGVIVVKRVGTAATEQI